MAALHFPLTHEWLHLPHEQAVGDSRAWAAASVERLSGFRDSPLDRGAVAAFTEHLDAVARHYARVGGLGCLLLVPDGIPPVRAMVRIESFGAPATGEELRTQCEALMPPTSWLVDPIEVSTVDSTAGPVLRMHVRTADPARRAAAVRDTFYWCWWFADVPETVLASAAFASVADSALWIEATEQMVLTVERADGPLAARGVLSDGAYGVGA